MVFQDDSRLISRYHWERRLEGRPLDHVQQKLAAFLHQQGLTNPDVSIAVVERFERQAGSGKVKETRRCAPTRRGEKSVCIPAGSMRPSQG
jgi:hypothetical protein